MEGPLTDRERDVVDLLAQGCCRKEVAASLGISVHTVNKHLQHAQTKTGITTDVGLAVWWYSITRSTLKPWTEEEHVAFNGVAA